MNTTDSVVMSDTADSGASSAPTRSPDFKIMLGRSGDEVRDTHDTHAHIHDTHIHDAHVHDRVCELMERLSAQVEQLGNRLDMMDGRLDLIEQSCGNMDNHINFISDAYGAMRAPLDYVCDRVSRITGARYGVSTAALPPPPHPHLPSVTNDSKNHDTPNININSKY